MENEILESLSKVYIKTDSQGRVTACEGGYTAPVDLTGWIEIDEGTGDRFNLCQSHYFEGGLTDELGARLYRYEDGVVRRSTGAELEEEREEIGASTPEPGPTAEERLVAVEDENRVLRGQVSAARENAIILEECLVEMAGAVYA